LPLAERLLLALSRDPRAPDHKPDSSTWTPENALDHLSRLVPGFLSLIAGRSVLDFGCGQGYQAVAMAQRGAARVLGVDAIPDLLAHGRRLARERGVEDRVAFAERIGEEHRGRFDVVLSQNSMEHFSDPVAALDAMASALRPGGRLVVTFSPPWLAPYGAHMYFFTRLPWVHLCFPERSVLAARARFRDDGATRYEEVEGGLNRMTLARFERLVAQSGLAVRYRRYEAVKGLPLVDRLPGIRELLVNSVTCTLERPALQSPSPS
jgi:SAM-dependent methyltransferase